MDWDMTAEEIVHCGEVGIVQDLTEFGYLVKFDDDDEQVRLNTFTE